LGRFNDCEIPEELHFDIENHVWVKFEADGTVSMGMTDVAQTLAGKLLYVKPKPVGTQVVKGKSVATVESGKYVGPMKTPLSGTITAINEEVTKKAILVNGNPYSSWVIKLQPSQLDAEKTGLVTGSQAVEAYSSKIQQLNVKCTRIVS
jgi:glycine cleavage system H protein